MVKAFFKRLMYWLIRLTPKMDYCYMKGMPSFDDSLVAVYNQLPMDRFSKVIWSTYEVNDSPPFLARGKTVFVKKGSAIDFFYGVFSKTIFTTHGHFIPEIPPNQNCVNVWHGMPFKAIGSFDGQPGRRDTFVCSTSPLYQSVLSEAFGVSKDRVLVSGLPRNDLMMSEDPASIWQKSGIDRAKYDKVFFWLPTFRKSVLGFLTEDGIECDNLFNMVDFPTGDFDSFLKDEKCLCIIKPHPMAPKKQANSSDNILIIDEKWLWERKLTLYTLIGQVDFLVSDISSVMIDFMLLDRPMIVCFEDSDQYKKSRNVIFDPLEDWLPGKIVDNYDDLKKSIRDCVSGGDPMKEKREGLKKKFHEHTDFKSTERLLSHVFPR